MRVVGVSSTLCVKLTYAVDGGSGASADHVRARDRGGRDHREPDGFLLARPARVLHRGRADRALYKAIWPGAATGYAFLFDDLGLPKWANFFVTIIAASMTKSALSGLFPKQRIWTRRVEWRRIDLDELLP
jgi:hypothetical protein